MTGTTSLRSRRVIALALALPLSLAMTGSALASGGSRVQPHGSESSARPGTDGAAQPAAKRAEQSAPAHHGKPPAPPQPQPQPLSNADANGTGANPGSGDCDHGYCSTRNGSPSGNGGGNGAATGKPCAGCVGTADNKNPKGQSRDGSDANAGYECDRNTGIGRSNPAHTGCTPGTAPAAPAQAAVPAKPAPAKPAPAKPAPAKPAAPATPSGGGGSTPGTGAERVTICHATGSTSNPYVTITPSVQAVLHGHAGTHHHGGRDVIPPFSWTDGGETRTFPGQGDQSLLATGCVPPAVSGPSPQAELCPDGSVMPQGGPAGCPQAPPVCPAASLLGPVMAGCESEAAPTPVGEPPVGGSTDQPAQGPPLGGVTPGQPATNPPLGGVTPGQPATNPPLGGVTPGQPATNPVPVGPPTTMPPRAVPITIVPDAGVGPVPLSGGPHLPAAGAVARALPATGTDAALLATLGLVLLVGGAGVLVVARTEQRARAC